jgi:mono/diheme cytochrome c family protein
MKIPVLFATMAGLALVGGLCTVGADSPKEVKKVSVSQTRADSGVDMFKTYCATCHGLDGKGHGPAADALKVAPADLTLLKQKNGGKYPSNKVSRIIEGADGITAHGTSDMPLWGPIFRSLDPGNTNLVKLRVLNVTKYIESLQK